MPVYISMLRGINVGANKRMKMEKLKASCEALGFEEVKTYIQSGNLIFKAAKASPAALSKRIEECIVSNFGFSVAVISRSREEMNRIIQGNPLLKEAGVDLGREIYFYFPNGVSGSSLWKHPLDRVLSVVPTMRNWNTVNKLYEMAVECG